jgi:serine/threonine-protein kinase
MFGDVAKAFGAACAAGQIACASPATGVRPTPLPPPPAECPPDSLETMREMGLRVGDHHGIEFHLDPMADSKPITVYAGLGVTIRQLGSWERLPIDTEFSGELFFGEERVYGRFTQAHLPNGPTLPVCLILVNRSNKFGVELEPGSAGDAARIISSERVRVVNRFE